MRLKTALSGVPYLNLKRRNLGYIGWVGYGNLGDEALYEAFRDEIFPGAQLLERLAGRLCQGVVLGGGMLINRFDTCDVRHALDRGYPVHVFGTGVAERAFWTRQGHAEIDDWAPLLKRCASACRRALDDGWRIEVLAMFSRDEAVCRRLVAELDSDQCRLSCIDRYTSRDYLDRVQECTAFLGERLHSVVLAHCRGVPAVMLEYQPKCRDYMEFMGQGENMFRTEDLDPAAVYRRLRSMAELRAEASEVLLSRALGARDSLRTAARRIAEEMRIP